MKVRVAQSCLTLCDSMDYILQAGILEWVAFPFSRGSCQPRDQTQVSHIAGGFLASEPPGKTKNTGVGSLSLLQGIFPTQESNWGLLHYRRIIYQLSYQQSPLHSLFQTKKELFTGELGPFCCPSGVPHFQFMKHKSDGFCWCMCSSRHTVYSQSM